MKEFLNAGPGTRQVMIVIGREDIWSILEALKRKQRSVIFSPTSILNTRCGLAYMTKVIRKVSLGHQVGILYEIKVLQ